MSMTFDEKRELMLAHAAGQAEAAELAQARELIASGDPESIGALAEAEAVLASLSLSLKPVAPGASLRDALMKRIASDAAGPTATTLPLKLTATPSQAIEASRRRRPAWWPTLASGLAAAVVAVAATLAYTSAERSRQRQAIAQLEADLHAQRDDLLLLKSDRASLASLRESLSSPGLRVIELAGTEAQPQAEARLLWDPRRGRSYFHARNLKPAGPDKDYQLWYVTADGAKVSLGVFDTDSGGGVAVALEFEPNDAVVTLAAVTDEPSGGVPQPTGGFQLMGEFN